MYTPKFIVGAIHSKNPIQNQNMIQKPMVINNQFSKSSSTTNANLLINNETNRIQTGTINLSYLNQFDVVNTLTNNKQLTKSSHDANIANLKYTKTNLD